jgi:hypothetical protein
MVPDFPSNIGFYTASNSGQSFEFSKTAESAHDSGFRVSRGNRYLANNKVDKTAGVAGQYVANSMIDYQVACSDLWFDPIHNITLVISDEDTSSGEDPGGPNDHSSDWEAP